MSFLVCDQVEKAFGATRVLEGVSFSLARGECLALLGASGCGKTTLLNIIAGFLGADSGTVQCDGVVMDAPASGTFVGVRQRKFAMVFQDFSLWPHLTVGENVAFGLRILKVPRAEREERVKKALDRVSMLHACDRLPTQLSGGQQQRVAIARALVVEPRIILLDEPLSALDATLREGLRDEIGALVRQTGMTAVYVTHDQSEALAIAHQVAVMRSGRIEQLAAPEVLYREPSNAFVASFIGVSNVVEYTRSGDRVIFGGGASLAAGSEAAGSGRFMVRREAIRIERGHEPPGVDGSHCRVQAVCERCLYLGERYEVTVTAEAGQTWRGYALQPVAMGEPVTLCFGSEALRFLPE